MNNNNRLDLKLINFGSEHPINIETTRIRGLEYDPVRRVYVDEDGCLIRDEFGQPF